MVICLQRDADLHMAQLMPLPLTVSCFSKIQTGFTFLVPEKGPLNVCVCIIIRNVAGVNGDSAYCKDSVGALAERAVVG